MKAAMHVTMALALVVSSGCSRTETPEQSAPVPAASSAQSAPAPSPAPAVPPASAANDPIPTHDEAARLAGAQISKANYKAELEKIEKDLQ